MSQPPTQNFQAIALMVFAMIAFGIDDAAIKLAGTLAEGGAATPGEIVIIKGVFGTLVYGALMLREGTRMTPALVGAMLRDPPLAWRTAGDLISAMAIITGLTVMPLSNLSAILQVQPLAITLGAALILGERVGWRRWSAIIVGFIGVMIIIRPGLEGFEAGTHWAVIAMIGLAVRDLATRKVKAQFSTFSIVTLVAALLVPMGLGMHFVMEDDPLLQGIAPLAWALILGGGVFGMAGYYAITLSVRLGEISVVAPYRYTRLLAALVLGFLVFGEVPDWPMTIGAALVIGAGLFTLYREQVVRKKTP
ncbi:MAG: DMT family transporter [Devosiaceae bacterium]|nr:DMT family transporter [Devosiaceae bacterium MH13]